MESRDLDCYAETMQNKWEVIVALAFVLALGSGCQHTGGVTPLPKSKNALIGDWELQQTTGTNRTGAGIVYSFSEGRLKVINSKKEIVSDNGYSVDSQPKPHWITLHVEDSVGGKRFSEERLGIFEINGDRLRLRWTTGGGARPTTFGTRPLELKKVTTKKR